MYLVKPVICSAVASAAISYYFKRPTLDKAGFQTLVQASLPAVGIQVISNLFAKLVANNSDKKDADDNSLVAYYLSGAGLTIAAMYYCNWSKTEATVMYVASSLLPKMI